MHPLTRRCAPPSPLRGRGREFNLPLPSPPWGRGAGGEGVVSLHSVMLISRCLALIILGLAPALAGDLRMGRASVEITPPPAMAMGGYFKIRLNTGKHDPLYAKAIVLEQDNVKVAMVFCDLLNLPRSFVDDARRVIEASTGVPPDHVMISATHSHTGPEMNHVFLDRLEGAPAQVAHEYRAELPRQIAEAVKEAEADLQPVEVWAGTGHEASLPFNRRYLMKDGSIAWNPGKLNPHIVRPAGPTDPAIPIVYFTSSAASPLATFVNYAMHADTTGGTEYSADYPGALARALATVKGSEMLTLFAIGAAGNINHLDVGRADRQQGPQESARIGAILAGDILKEYPRLTRVEGPLRFRRAIIALPVQQLQPGEVEKSRELVDRAVHQGPEGIPFLQLVQAVKALLVSDYQGKPIEAEVDVVTLGRDVAWVGVPGELFVELGMAIKNASPFQHTIVDELTNDSIHYVPDLKAFAEGNYEVVNSFCAPGGGEKLVETSTHLLIDAYMGN